MILLHFDLELRHQVFPPLFMHVPDSPSDMPLLRPVSFFHNFVPFSLEIEHSSLRSSFQRFLIPFSVWFLEWPLSILAKFRKNVWGSNRDELIRQNTDSASEIGHSQRIQLQKSYHALGAESNFTLDLSWDGQEKNRGSFVMFLAAAPDSFRSNIQRENK